MGKLNDNEKNNSYYIENECDKDKDSTDEQIEKYLLYAFFSITIVLLVIGFSFRLDAVIIFWLGWISNLCAVLFYLCSRFCSLVRRRYKFRWIDLLALIYALISLVSFGIGFYYKLFKVETFWMAWTGLGSAICYFKIKYDEKKEDKEEHEKYVEKEKQTGPPLDVAFYKIIGAVLSCNPSNQSAKEDLISAAFPKIFENQEYKNFVYFAPSTAWNYLNDGANLEKPAAVIVDFFDFVHRRNLIRLLFKLAANDDGIKNDEWQRLLNIMKLLKMNKSNYNYFIRQYACLRTEFDDYSSQYQSSGSSSSSGAYSTTSSALSSDYALLGLPISATRRDVQAAYHSLALQYHPDLPKNAGKQQFCIDQMAKINAAYDRIMANFA